MRQNVREFGFRSEYGGRWSTKRTTFDGSASGDTKCELQLLSSSNNNYYYNIFKKKKEKKLKMFIKTKEEKAFSSLRKIYYIYIYSIESFHSVSQPTNSRWVRLDLFFCSYQNPRFTSSITKYKNFFSSLYFRFTPRPRKKATVIHE